MKIEKNTLLSFIEKFRMVDHSSIDEAIFKFPEEGLRIVAYDASNCICSSAFLKSSSLRSCITEESFENNLLSYIKRWGLSFVLR